MKWKRRGEPEIKLFKISLSPGATAVQTHYSPITDMHRSSTRVRRKKITFLICYPFYRFFLSLQPPILPFHLTAHLQCIRKNFLHCLSGSLRSIISLCSKVQHVFPAMHSRESLLCELRPSATIFDPNSITTFFFFFP